MKYVAIKRVIDIAASAAALLLLLPLLAAIAVWIRLETPGSPLFMQTRVGRDGRPFRIAKFRSMVKDAPRLGPESTSAGDPRITRAGHFIRKTSIDELPQLWNVVTGDMSLIGPRPATPSQEAIYTPADWKARHRVRPGITGLAQVSGRSGLTLETQARYDVEYATHPTWRRDLRILIETIRQVIRKTGVN